MKRKISISLWFIFGIIYISLIFITPPKRTLNNLWYNCDDFISIDDNKMYSKNDNPINLDSQDTVFKFYCTFDSMEIDQLVDLNIFNKSLGKNSIISELNLGSVAYTNKYPHTTISREHPFSLNFVINKSITSLTLSKIYLVDSTPLFKINDNKKIVIMNSLIEDENLLENLSKTKYSSIEFVTSSVNGVFYTEGIFSRNANMIFEKI